MMKFENYKIMIFTRSMNYALYKASNNTILIPFERKRLTYTSAHGYLYDILKYDIDYAINIDEDAFVIDNNALLDLLEFVIKNDYVNCGVRDGGALSIRTGNPVVTNPFFNIFNVKEIRKHFSLSEIDQYIKNGVDYSKFIPDNLPHEYNITDNYEPFYPFFIWLNTKFKTFYLDAEQDKDGYTTIVYNQNKVPIMYHSWYSRMFGIDEFHTQRIMNLYTQCTTKSLKFSLLEKGKIAGEKFVNNKLMPSLLPIRRFILSKIKK
ncbi:hypothetical protein EG347_09170 [Chryseobacterium sp. G0186]|uniref:hypothetical protein n=1 Tax=Chryseobacterium sp. G0186 TaxID=2487064 RepID=UPI000F4E47A0|nr:hypothetical protein [Chryseobacterium sp. G0186]AZA77676.1 hypothetical protein EG347_09170 [Chryseobacterium sp. G0186]